MLKRGVGGLIVGVAIGACAAGDETSGGEPGGDAGAGYQLLDPGFANTPRVWTAANGATIEDWVPPGVDVGVARFPAATGGAIWQTVTAPPFSGTSYALEVTGVASANMTIEPHLDNAPLGRLALLPSVSKARVCLGERAFGGPLTFGLHAERPWDDDPMPADLDRAEIVLAPECPAVGAFRNGDLSSAEGWSSPYTTVAFPDGRGNLKSTGNFVLTHEPVSFPSGSLERPALRFTSSGHGDPLDVSFGGEEGTRAIGSVIPSATPTTASLCVPAWAKGLVLPATFSLRTPTGDSEHFFDDVSIVSDPKCDPIGLVLDPGFEDTGSASPWAFGGARIVSGAGAHGGSAHAELRVESCGAAGVSQIVTAPRSNDGGSTLKFWYKAAGGSHSTFSIEVAKARSGSIRIREELPVAAEWTEGHVFIPSELGNQPVRLVFSTGVYDTLAAGSSCVPGEVATLAIDDVAVTVP